MTALQVLDPSLEPVLAKMLFKQSGRMMLRLGDTDVDYNEDFKFYVTTKLPNPHYPPEICVKVTVINFTVTLKGLEDQLLASIVGHERPDLEEQNNELVVQVRAFNLYVNLSHAWFLNYGLYGNRRSRPRMPRTVGCTWTTTRSPARRRRSSRRRWQPRAVHRRRRAGWKLRSEVMRASQM